MTRAGFRHLQETFRAQCAAGVCGPRPLPTAILMQLARMEQAQSREDVLLLRAELAAFMAASRAQLAGDTCSLALYGCSTSNLHRLPLPMH